MKKLVIMAMAGLAVIASCNKKPPYGGNNDNPHQGPDQSHLRKVRYEFYTDQDFAGDTKNITVTLRMGTSREYLFDSSLAVMKVEDIPDYNHRIIVEKLVPGNDMSTLKVYFLYYIDGVGYYWHLKQFPYGETFIALDEPYR